MTTAAASEAAVRFPLRFILALTLMGLTELIAQVVLTRELLATFLGNELSIALVLAVWLVSVAAGSALGSWVAPRIAAPMRAFGWSQMLLACLLPLALFVARWVQPGDLTPGQVLGPGAMLLTSLCVLALVCLVGGFQFVVAARAAGYRGQPGERAGERAVSPVGLVYALEAAGAVLGGIAFHFYLAAHVGPLRTLAGAGVLNIVSACALLRPRLLNKSAIALVPALAAVAGLLVLSVRAEEFEIASLRGSPRWASLTVSLAQNARDRLISLDSLFVSPRWRSLYAKLPEEVRRTISSLCATPLSALRNPRAFAASKYGALIVTEQEQQVSFYQSGVLLFTSGDEYSNEVAAHTALLQHPAPRRVLLIGGGVAGLAGEMVKHPITELDCVELDPRVVELARRWLPEELLQPLSDPRVRLHLGDGRLYVKHAQAPYDVIVLNLPDPTTAAINRFYTREFFEEAYRALAPRGVLAFNLTGSSHHFSGTVLLAASTMHNTLGGAFPEQLVVPGDQMFFFAAKEPGVLSGDWRRLADRLERRGIEASFVNEVWLQDALLPFRREMLLEAIRGESEARLNSDLNPVSYYHQTRIWLDQLSSGLARPLQLLSPIEVWWAAIPIGLAVVVVAVTRGRGGRLTGAAVLIAAGAIGGFGLLVELLALLAFQSACGYLYHALGALIAAFMAGLAIGSAVVSRREIGRRHSARIMLAGLGAAGLVCVVLPGLLAAVLQAPSLAPIALSLALLLVGSMVGGLFPVATTLYRGERSASRAGGAVYAADLVGSAGGALAAGVIAIPLLGAAGASYAGALLLGAAFVLGLTLLRE